MALAARGRPPGRETRNKPFKAVLQRRIMLAEEKGGLRNIDAVALALIRKAKEGDVPAIKEIAERLDGRTSSLLDGDDAASLLLASIKVMFINAGQDSNSGVSGETPMLIPSE